MQEGAPLPQRGLSAKAVRRLKALSNSRPWLAPLILSSPLLVVLVSDVSRRGERLLSLGGHYRWTYLGSIAESLVVWGLLLYGAGRRRGWLSFLCGVLFVVFFTFSVGGQAYFFEQYSAYFNIDVSKFASNFKDSVANQFLADFGNYVASKLPIFLLALLLVWASRRLVRPKRLSVRVAGALAPLALIGSFFVPTQHRHVQASTPDTLYLEAVGGLIMTQAGMTEQSNQLRPRARESLHVGKLTPRMANPPNVLFLILESVRADSVCVFPDPDCKETPFSNELTPERFGLGQMRSLASSTAISLAVMWAGVGPHESREVLHTWPLIFDYAEAAGYDTAFWTSQNMMFGNSRLWVKNLGVSHFCAATELDPTADLDMGAPEQLLAARVNQELPELKEPFLAVVQLSNVHYPYLLDPDGPQPFQPATTSKGPESNAAFKNHYKNAVHQQDRHVASMIKRLRATEAGKRTVIFYTSDHAEAFREHGQMGHTFSVFDEEIKVPGWIDAPPGTLTQEQRSNLANKKDEFTFHPDLTATILDVMGVWDEPELRRFKKKIIGVSLLGPSANQGAMPMTNCAGVWSCAFDNWGYMRGNMKLEAREWDTGYKCYDLRADPREQRDLGEAACGDLLSLAQRTFQRLPGQGKVRER